ncbi:MAG: toll/interleukin-1 receptor domain-containing protein [Clostridia bacterium]|nr:toll/interleukin-1 receptor domain-containing protein [Clostridia bacterium]
MDVFISYSSKDRQLVKEICAFLKQNGISYWVDFENDQYGDTFASTIVNQIKSAKQMLLFVTEHSNTSDHVLREINCADKYKKPILPVLVGEVNLSADFEYYLSDLHFLSYSSDPSFSEVLLARLRGSSAPVQKEGTTTLKAEAYVPQKKNQPILLIALVAVIALLIGIGTFLGNSGDITGEKDPHSGGSFDSEQKEPASQNPTQSSSKTTEEEQKNTGGENQIPEKYRSKVVAFDSQDDGFIKLGTLNVQVGETVTPTSAQVWGNCTLYSENTAVAVCEGAVIRGVAPGRVHVLVESSTGSTQVHLICVS